MNFVIHLDEILIAITSVVTAASAICALTPTPKDDNFVAKIRSVLNVLALNVGKVKPATVSS
ncbi:MAG: hypothetical protein J6P93_05460 [Alphaproteobacteria bacterium]|nr:hypothetical protein [Alphaproteobacteria bacterium]